MPVCPNCGKEVSEGVTFCPDCGQRLKIGVTPEEKEQYIQELETSVKEERPAEKPKITKSQLAGIIVGSIVAIIIIISAISICAPTESPSLTASEQNYAATMADHSSRFVEAMGKLSDLMGEPQIGNDEWIIDVAIQLTAIRLLYDEALDIEPPSSMAHIHYKYLQAMDHFDRSVDLIAEGTDTLNTDLLGQAISELELGNDYIEETTRLTYDFIAARSL